jgi:transposase-like protein
MEYIGLPTLRGPGASVPDGRTIRRDRFDLSRTSAPAILIPVTNAIEALNAKLRRGVKIRGHFPTDEAAIKLLYSSCATSPRNGKCRRDGAKPRPNSPSFSM